MDPLGLATEYHPVERNESWVRDPCSATVPTEAIHSPPEVDIGPGKKANTNRKSFSIHDFSGTMSIFQEGGISRKSDIATCSIKFSF